MSPRIRALVLVALAAQTGPAGLAGAQEAAPAPSSAAETAAVPAGVSVARGRSALLRGLDKVSGRTTDLTLAVGEAVSFGRLDVRLGECRYPVDDPSSDAFAQMIITDTVRGVTVFSGWMVASSPALSALDDARYDVWVISCHSD